MLALGSRICNLFRRDNRGECRLGRKTLLPIVPLLLLSACEMTVDVEGMLGVNEPLTGSITLYDDGGTIELFGGPKTHCVGNFQYHKRGNERGGEGTMVCDDRRLGPFSFVLDDARRGRGTGKLNETPYSFRF